MIGADYFTGFIYTSIKIENGIILQTVCTEIKRKMSGNFIEIGAGSGESSKMFLELAKKHDSKLVVIDPFEDGWDSEPDDVCKPYPYEKFQETVDGYENELVLVKKKSQDETVYDDVLPHAPFCFSFIDGLQYRESVLSDLNLMHRLNCGIICVDDYTRNTYKSQVSLAVEDFMKFTNGYRLISEKKIERAKAFLINKNL